MVGTPRYGPKVGGGEVIDSVSVCPALVRLYGVSLPGKLSKRDFTALLGGPSGPG